MSSWDIFQHGIFSNMGYFPDGISSSGILSSGILSSWDFFLLDFFLMGLIPTWDFVIMGFYPDTNVWTTSHSVPFIINTLFLFLFWITTVANGEIIIILFTEFALLRPTVGTITGKPTLRISKDANVLIIISHVDTQNGGSPFPPFLEKVHRITTVNTFPFYLQVAVVQNNRDKIWEMNCLTLFRSLFFLMTPYEASLIKFSESLLVC